MHDRLRYLEGMERVHQALDRGGAEAEALLQGCVEAVLEVFGADRCMLAFPCDPDSDEIRFPFYAERPGVGLPPFPRALSPVPDALRRSISDLLRRTEPSALGPERPSTVSPDNLERLRIRSRLTIAIRPTQGPAWNLTLHQCLRDREWTPQEIRLFRDIAARIRSALETLGLTRVLRRSEAFLHDLMEGMPQLVWTTDAGGKVEFVNRRWMEYTGQDREHSLAAGGLDAVHPDDRARCLERWGAAFAAGVPYEAELRYRRADGTYLWHLARAYPIRDESGNLIRWIGTCTDISEARRAASELERSRAQLATILSGAADAILALGPDGTLIYANEAAARLFGLPSAEALVDAAARAAAEGRRDAIRFTDEKGEPVPIEDIPTRRALRGLEPAPALLRFRPAGAGPERWVVTRAKPIFDEAGKVSMVISLTQDVTELRARDEALRGLERLESLGKLAGGIAHDFNNLLVAINGYSDLGMQATGDQPALREYFAEIHRSGQRAATLTQQLLAYGRKQMVRPRRISLNAVIGDMQPLLARVVGEEIRLRTALAADPPPVQADPGQLEQAILNLVVNAREAMPAGGVVTLETGLTEVEAGREDMRAGRYATLTVRDTGIGMEPAVLARAFEPFFTTKDVGKGSGLGLASVYGIVKQCGGHVEAESERGRGSLFRLYLPVDEGPAPASPPETPGRADRAGGGRAGIILLAEDEDSVRHFAERALAGRGFRVHAAADGREALRLAETLPSLDLLVTDVVMPHLRGPELAARVLRAHPGARVLLMSGYPDDTGLAAGEREGWSFLQKPFRADQLLAKADALLPVPAPAPGAPGDPAPPGGP